jgi:aspartate oxidase
VCPVRPDDNPYMHFLDTIGGGHYTNVPEIVRALVLDGPEVADWLMDLGVMFDFEEDGTLKVNHCGGHSRKRMLSCKDLTGLELMRVLRDEIKNREIPYMEFTPAVEILLDDEGHCAGAVLYNMETEEFFTVKAKAVILASGGIGRLHIQQFPTTNHYGATADGLVIAYRAGAELIHMDSIQYHPTGVVWPEQLLGQLITEVMRGHGAQLVNVDGNRFINELECRDTCASACIRECVDRKKGVVTPTGMEGVWLDTPLIPGIDKHFVGIYQRFKKYNIDISQEPILIFPTQHYQNGGLKITPHGETTVPGLYAAGEVSGGVQGKNRLAGNSLLDIFVFGRRSAKHAMQVAGKKRPSHPGACAHLSPGAAGPGGGPWPTLARPAARLYPG